MITVKELNEIQAQWMALDSNDSESRKQEVFALMDKIPLSYITYNGTNANMVIRGAPFHATGLPLNEIKEIAPRHNARTDIAWNCNGAFITI